MTAGGITQRRQPAKNAAETPPKRFPPYASAMVSKHSGR